MSYANKQDMIKRYGTIELVQISDRDHSGNIDDSVLTSALTDADGLINSYIAARYTLPYSPATPMLTKIACEIARYMLYGDQVTERVKDDYDYALRFLRDVREGKADLGESPRATEPAQGAVKTRTAVSALDWETY